MSVQKALEMIRENDVKFIDFRFADTRGKEQHVTVPAHTIDEDTFEDGKMFDGSSVAGWKGINESDMILMPEAASAKLDPFFDDTTMILRLTSSSQATCKVTTVTLALSLNALKPI